MLSFFFGVVLMAICVPKSESEDMLAQMADNALEEFNSNTTTPLIQNNFDFSCLQ